MQHKCCGRCKHDSTQELMWRNTLWCKHYVCMGWMSSLSFCPVCVECPDIFSKFWVCKPKSTCKLTVVICKDLHLWLSLCKWVYCWYGKYCNIFTHTFSLKTPQNTAMHPGVLWTDLKKNDITPHLKNRVCITSPWWCFGLGMKALRLWADFLHTQFQSWILRCMRSTIDACHQTI